MSTQLRSSIVVAVALLASVASQSASAQYPSAGWPYSNGFGYQPILSYRAEQLPYFSVHPPVYYSQPVARTYGYSPYAYPPGTMTPEIADVSGPQEVINPYAPQSSLSPAANDDAEGSDDASAGSEPGPAFPRSTPDAAPRLKNPEPSSPQRVGPKTSIPKASAPRKATRPTVDRSARIQVIINPFVTNQSPAAASVLASTKE